MLQMDLVQFKLVHPNARCPQRGTSHSGAFDIFSPEDGVIRPFERTTVGTGVAHQINPRIHSMCMSVVEASKIANHNMWVPFHLQGIMIPRSGLAAKKGIRLFFAPCLIDHDYRGEIKITLENATREVFEWTTGDRLCQIAYIPHYAGECTLVETLTPTERGEGGHGSTGR